MNNTCKSQMDEMVQQLRNKMYVGKNAFMKIKYRGNTSEFKVCAKTMVLNLFEVATPYNVTKILRDTFIMIQKGLTSYLLYILVILCTGDLKKIVGNSEFWESPC